MYSKDESSRRVRTLPIFFFDGNTRFIIFDKLNILEQVQKDNIENVTIDDLVAKVTPIGRQKVPAQVKEEILLRLRNFLEDE